jgi:preprotein translocase SecE subunit
LAANTALSKFPPINWFRTMRRFLKDAMHELREVVWPSMDELRQYTILVISVLLGVTVFIGLCQFGLQYIMDHVLNLYGTHGG